MQNLNTNDDKYKNNKDSKDIPAISTRIGQPIPKIQRIVWIKLNIANINGINFNRIISTLYNNLFNPFTSIFICIYIFC